MTETSNEKSKTPAAKQAALVSLLTPFIAMFLTSYLKTNAKHSGEELAPFAKIIMGYCSVTLITVGFICGIVGMLGIKKHGSKEILGKSIIGIFLNGIILVSLAYVFINGPPR